MTKFRTESDLIGDLQVPADAYYGVQTQRAIENFRITGTKMGDYPEFVKAIGYVKLAAAQTNHALGLLPDELLKPISEACKEVIEGKFNHQFLVDMIQGGAGTSVNMNANEVIANRALEIMGYPRGDYQHCSPNDHVNQSQSTNDAYPTTVKLAVIKMNETLIKRLSLLIEAFRKKGKEFADGSYPVARCRTYDAWSRIRSFCSQPRRRNRPLAKQRQALLGNQYGRYRHWYRTQRS